MGTYAPKGPAPDPRWYLVNAEGETLGRLATVVATHLRGKHRTTFAPNYDHGDHVIVVNASKVVMTGNKLQQKYYRRHSGYPGGIKEVVADDLITSRPERIIESAVAGMLPKNSIGRKLIKKLKVYAGPEHPHVAQRPEPLSIRSSGASNQENRGR